MLLAHISLGGGNDTHLLQSPTPLASRIQNVPCDCVDEVVGRLRAYHMTGIPVRQANLVVACAPTMDQHIAVDRRGKAPFKSTHDRIEHSSAVERVVVGSAKTDPHSQAGCARGEEEEQGHHHSETKKKNMSVVYSRQRARAL